MTLAVQDLERLARLARLEFSAAEVERYQGELNTILGMVDALKQAQTDGVEPLAHPLDMAQRLRPDAVTEPEAREALLGGAPETRDGLFVVPRVIE